MAKASLSSMMKDIKPIEGFTSMNSSNISKQTRPISKWSHNYNMKQKGNKSYKKQSRITNSSKSHISAKNPNNKTTVTLSETKITSDINRAMKFHLNMTYGVNSNSYEKNTTNYFDRLYSVYPDKELDNVCQYVFIVRPSLNILNAKGTALVNQSGSKKGYLPNSCPAIDQTFRYMFKNYPYILRSLTPSLSAEHDFIPFLVGRTESLQIPDYSVKKYMINQPFTNYNLPYASHAIESRTGGQFEINFRDDDELRIHKMFQTWLYYIDGVTRNIFGPTTYNIKHNKIDYATSVYCITCKQDAETIIYWSKYTGAFPTSVPNSDISFNLRGQIQTKLAIPFDYMLQESMDPLILVDFNKNAHLTKVNNIGYIPVYRSATLGSVGFKDPRSSTTKKMHGQILNGQIRYNKNYPVSVGTGNGLVGCPFICKDGNTREYKLRWRTIKDLSK